MGKKRGAAKQPDVRGNATVSVTQQNEALLGSWAAREIQNKLQCSPEEAQHCAAMIMSMDTKQLREWCSNLLGDLEKRMDDDRKFYNLFLDKKEDLGLLGGNTQQADDAASECGSVATTATTATTATSKGKARKFKQVDLTKMKEGHDALLPMMKECGCEATRHKLLTNCQLCGKIVCEQEGWGRCFFCGSEISKESKPIKGKNDTDGMPPSPHQHKTDKQYLSRERDFLKAVAQRDKLIQYQDDRQKRTTIVDDQEDYYESSNPWLDAKERKKAQENERKDREARQARHKRGGAYTVHIDLVNRNVTEGLSASQQAVQYEAPIEKRAREEKERMEQGKEEEEETNVHAATTLYTAGPTTVVEEESDEDEEGNRLKTMRIMRCPDTKTMQFDSSAILAGWVRGKLVSYGFSEEEAEKQGTFVKKMTNMGAVRGWAKDNLDADVIPSFVEEFQSETRRLELVGPKSKRGAADEEKRDIRREAVKGSGRIQSDWEEVDDAYKAPVQKIVSSIKKKKPWVYVNSGQAVQLDKVYEVSESKMCMSMHQPWASLLVCGIKKHEGRTWPTDFRGRLWIHAASHQPSEQDIEDCEAFYAERGATTFPTHYPTSVLLGCVTVTDCLHYEEYEKKIPEPEQESSSEHVFICKNPQLLVWESDVLLNK